MKNTVRNRMNYLIAGSAIFGALLIGTTAFAAGPGGFGHGMRGRMTGVFGTVASVSGNTITVTSKGFGQNTTPTTYIVDATSATVTKNGTASTIGNVTVGDTISVQGTVNGTNVTATTIRDGAMGGFGRGMDQKPGVFGTVTSVSGNTITITGKGFGPNPTATTYTVDGTNATVTKNGAASTISTIAVGDTISVQGTIRGSNVSATMISDGLMRGRGMNPGATSIIKGNGLPVIAGAITAINSSTLTVTNKSNVTYTVDATSATIEKGGVASSLSNVAIGDNVVIQGTVNGTSVTASSLIDSGTKTVTTNSTAPAPHRGGLGGFLGGIGMFFHDLFGF